MNTVQVLAFPWSNLGSLLISLRFLGVDVNVVGNGDKIRKDLRTVLPGVGSFSSAVGFLESRGYADGLREISSRDVPLFGICLGLQILMESGHEGGAANGLGIFSGTVKPLAELGTRKYHTGWRKVLRADQTMGNFYFSHGYYVVSPYRDKVGATCEVDGKVIPAMLSDGFSSGVQYHPELSGFDGVLSMKKHLYLD